MDNRKPRSVTDPNEIACEIYNRLDEELVFTNVHPDRDKQFFMGQSPVRWARIVCKPKSHCFLPHQFYVVTTKSGRPAELIKIYGNDMFKGMTKPSRPEAQTTKFFVKG